MREIFFKEKLGETPRNSEGVQAARAERGWWVWDFGGETRRFWREGMVGAVRIIE